MINKTLKLFLISTLFSSVHAESWSRYVQTKNRDDVEVSFRQKRENSGWQVEWKVENNSADTIEPVLKFRKYICKNGSSQEIGVQQSLGVMEPESRKLNAIRDQKICLNSTIELVEIETEIIESGL